jgi:hypothetical protein
MMKEGKMQSEFVVKDGMRFEIRPFENGEFLVRRYEVGGKTWSSFMSTNTAAGQTVKNLIDRFIESRKNPMVSSSMSKAITAALNGK